MNRSSSVKLGRDEAHFQRLHSKLDSFLLCADKKYVYESEKYKDFLFCVLSHCLL